MPCDYSQYHPDWRWIRLQILEQAGHCCEFCGVENDTMRGETRIVLTIAHLDHDISNNEPSNLRALCQRCHLRWDHAQHQINAALTRARKRTERGQMELAV
jgi:5-methylcytosine-specific restriction endonuclease McrA